MSDLNPTLRYLAERYGQEPDMTPKRNKPYMVPLDPPYTMTDAMIDASIKAMIDELNTVLEEE